ncbi:MAG: helix-turn-helix transcriptional regulator [Gammaproteobacteria bacterium]
MAEPPLEAAIDRCPGAPVQTLSVDPTSVFAYYHVADESGGDLRMGLRFAPSFAGAAGYRELVEICPGFQVLMGDLRYDASAEITLREDASLKFHYRLSGVSEIAVREEGVIHIDDHTGGVLLHPDGVLKQERYLAGQHERSVTLICSAEFLGAKLASLGAALPAAILDYISGKPAGHYQQHVPLRAGMASAAAALFAIPAGSPTRRLMIEARALELLALSIESMDTGAHEGERPERGLASRDVQCLQQARRILERDFLAPPTIAGLARAVGINEAKLMHAFKQIFGLTVFDFTQALRMEKAKSLLETTDLSITEIAFEVGYEYSSNFTTAFKRHFGITPSTARDALRPHA